MLDLAWFLLAWGAAGALIGDRLMERDSMLKLFPDTRFEVDLRPWMLLLGGLAFFASLTVAIVGVAA